MENKFTEVMSKRTDEELIKIVTVDKDGYEPLALAAAKQEIKNRNIDISNGEATKTDVAFEIEKLDELDQEYILKKEEFNNTKEPNPSKNKSRLTFYWPPVIVVGIGSFLGLISMFLPHLSSYEVSRIENNLMIQNKPAFILCSIGAIISIFRFWSVGSKSSANGTIWIGIWFLGWTIYDANTAQLINLLTKTPVITTAAAGLWAFGVSTTLVALGGLMMRFPHSNFGLIIGETISKEEANQIVASTKTCPKCAETIKFAALVCRYCGHQFKNDNTKNNTDVN